MTTRTAAKGWGGEANKVGASQGMECVSVREWVGCVCEQRRGGGGANKGGGGEGVQATLRVQHPPEPRVRLALWIVSRSSRILRSKMIFTNSGVTAGF